MSDLSKLRRIALIAVIVGGGIALTAPFFAKSIALDKAERAGIRVDSGDVSLGFGSATLRNVEWSLGPASATIDHIDVEVALTSVFTNPRIESVRARGIKAKIARGAPTSSEVSASATGAAFQPGKLVQRMLDRLGGAPPQVVLDDVEVAAVIDADRRVTLKLEHAQSTLDGARWTMIAPATLDAPAVDGISLGSSVTAEASLSKRNDAWEVDHAIVRFAQPITATREGRNLSVEAVGLSGSLGALAMGIEARDVSTWVDGAVTVERVELSPLMAVLAGDRGSVGHVYVSGLSATVQQPTSSSASVDSAGGPRSANDRAAELLERLFSQADTALARADALGDTRLELAGATLRLPQFGAQLAIHDAQLVKTQAGRRATTTLELTRAQNSTGAVTFAYTAGSGRVEVETKTANLAFVGAILNRRLSGNASANVVFARTNAQPPTYEVQGTLRVDELQLESSIVAAAPVAADPIDVEVRASYAPYRPRPNGPRTDGVIAVENLEVRVANAVGKLSGSVVGLQALPLERPERATVRFEVPSTPIEQLLAAVPDAILGPLKDAKIRGSFGVTGDIDVPLRAPERLKWSVAPVLRDVRIDELPHPVDVRRLLTASTYTIRDPKLDFTREVYVPAPGSAGVAPPTGGDPTSAGGCGPYKYTPLPLISPHLPSGVLSTEDRGFLWHDGFNEHALRESIAANIAEGRIVRGGSTITMQLIKNLFLSHNRTIARKLREMFLVWLTESIVDVPKSRLLEVYLNVIEYGPKVHGIAHGAAYFFGKHPRDLTVGQAAWFITTLTGPKIYHHQFQKRAISDSVWGRMKARVDMMYDNDYVTELDLVLAKKQRPAFRPAGTGCSPQPGFGPKPDADDRIIAAELLRMRQAGMERPAVTALHNDPAWQAKTLAARPTPAPIDWHALPLRRDKYSWWRGR